MPKTRKGGRKSHKKGGSAVGGLMAAIKKALPSYLLYQAVKMHQKKKRGGGKTRRGGRHCMTHKKKHKKKKRGGRKTRRGGRTRRRR